MRCTQMSVHQKRLRIVQRLIILALKSANEFYNKIAAKKASGDWNNRIYKTDTGGVIPHWKGFKTVTIAMSSTESTL